MRNLRWAAELAVHDDDRMADLGVAELTALLDSDVLEDPEKVFVEAALDAVYGDVEAELDELGEGTEVVQEAQRVSVVEADSVSDARDDGVSSTGDDGGERHG